MIDLSKFNFMKIGDKVICIDDYLGPFPDRYKKRNNPVKYSKYTIREVVVIDGVSSILLEEIVNEKVLFSGPVRELEPSFNPFAFIVVPD